MKNLINTITFKYLAFLRKLIYITFYYLDTYFLRKEAQIVILCYHSISKSSWRFAVSLDNFKEQIDYLISRKYNFITLSDLLKYIEGKKKIFGPSVVITFDDGYKDNLTVKSFLKSHNIRPTLFVLSDTKNANRLELDNRKEFLNKKDILDLVAAGWEIGSHTATHSNMDRLSNDQIYKEIIDSKKSLRKELGVSINYLAFPKGKYNPKIIRTVKKAKYKLSLTMNDGKIQQNIDKYLIPRIGVDGSHSFSEFKGAISLSTILFRKYLKEKTLLKNYL